MTNKIPLGDLPRSKSILCPIPSDTLPNVSFNLAEHKTPTKVQGTPGVVTALMRQSGSPRMNNVKAIWSKQAINVLMSVESRHSRLHSQHKVI